MKLHILPAEQGYQWLHQAKNITLANRHLFISNVFFYLAACFLASILSLGASFILIIAVGILGVIFNMTVMLICDCTLNPVRYEPPATLFQLWSNTLKNKRILILALITAIALTLIAFIMNTIAISLFPQVIEQGEQLLTLQQNNPEMEISLSQLLSLMPYYALVIACNILSQSIAFFFFCMTPAIIYWTNTPYGKAIFYNLMGCLKNWRAWLAWAGAVLFFFVVIPVVVITILVNIAQGASTLSILAIFLIMVLFFVLFFLSMTMIPASYYLAYKNCFIHDEHEM